MSLDLRRPRRRPFLRAEQWEQNAIARMGRYCFSQDDQSVANAAGATVRADINSNLQALVTRSSGASAPGTSWAYQPWADTTNGLLKRRNAANSAWLVENTLAETFALARSSNTILGLADWGRTFNFTSTFTQTITAAATLGDGWWCEVRNNGTGVITIDPNSSETIDGATTLDLAPGYSCVISCNGSAFTTIGLTRRRAEVTPGGRITLTTAVPVTVSDVTGATTVYYSPLEHDTVELYDGAGWNKHQFAELSQATSDNTKSPAAVAASKVYDIFVWNDAGTLRATRGPAWSSDTSRGTGAATTELELFEGRYMNKIAITNGPAARRGLYVGSIRSDASSQINDAFTLRHVWNMYNRRVRTMRNANETTDTWNYSTSTVRQANANTANQLDFLRGLDEDTVTARVSTAVVCTGGNNAAYVGIGLDSTTTVDVPRSQSFGTRGVNTTSHPIGAVWSGYPGLGRHTLTWLEYATAATTTWSGDDGAPTIYQAGIQGECRA